MDEYQKLVIPDDIEVYLDEEYVPNIRKMLKNREAMFLGDFSETNVYLCKFVLQADEK